MSPIRPGAWLAPMVVAAAATLLLSACSPEVAPVSPDVSEWPVGRDPIVSIGGLDEREGYALFDVRAGTVLSDGRIVIANSGTEELRFFSADGAFLQSVGGPGQGPGEFRNLLDFVRLPGDTLMVLSADPGLTWVGPTGQFLRSSRFLLRTAFAPCRMTVTPILLRDERLLLSQEDNLGVPGCPSLPDGLRRATSLVSVFNPSTGETDSLGVFPSTDRYGPFFLPHGRLLLVAASAHGFFVGDTGADSVLVFDSSGARLPALETPFPATPVPRQGRERRVERWPRADGTIETHELPYPDRYPRFSRIVADSQGYVWAMAHPRLPAAVGSVQYSTVGGAAFLEPGREWAVLHPTQGLAARVTTPAGFYPLQIGADYLLGVTRDSVNVETVRLYPLERH